MDSAPFALAAPFYDAHRAPYAPAAIEHVVARFGLGPGKRVLDLGCGPGTLAIPLSRTGAEVTAVDLDGAMLGEARRLAALRGAGGIDWLEARAEDALPRMAGRFDLVVFGQSLHWMDRDRILALAGEALTDRGGLAIFDEGARQPQESWQPTAAAVLSRYLGRRPRDPRKSAETAHAPSLARSALFAGFTALEFSHAIVRDLPSILGCLYSGVAMAPSKFGDRLAAFEAELGAALLALNPSGVFEERLETALIVAGPGLRPH